MSERVLVLTLSLLLSISLWACGGGSETGSEGTAEGPEPMVEGAAPEAVAEGTIAGDTFTTTVTADEAAADPGAVGTWDLALASDGTFTVSQNGEVAVQGRYTVDGDRITFADESGPVMCADDPEGTYRWSLMGDDLMMTSVDDVCPGRLTVLTAHPLTRK